MALNETWACPECEGKGKVKVTRKRVVARKVVDQEYTLTCERCNGEGVLSIKVEPDFSIVAIEETEYWRDDIVEQVGRIWRLYLVNFNEYTYLAEVTPSVFAWHLYGVSENEITDTDDDLYYDIWSGYLYEESDYFRPQFLKKRIVYRLENGRDYNLSFHAWESESGYREMVDDISQDFRENPIGILKIDDDGNPVWSE